MTVDLPAPVSPTRATVSPGSMDRSTPRNASSMAVGYRKWTASKATAPANRPGSIGCSASGVTDVGLRRAHARQARLQVGVDRRDLVAGPYVGLVGFAPEPPGGEDERGHDDERGRHEPGVHHGQENKDTREAKQAYDGVDEAG